MYDDRDDCNTEKSNVAAVLMKQIFRDWLTRQSHQRAKGLPDDC